MRLMFAAAAVAAIAAAAPAIANAQDAEAGAYVNLGYAHTSSGGLDFGAVGARLGYRVNKWVGVEGEGAFGVDDDKLDVSGTSVKVELKHTLAAYLVGFVPVSPNADVLARVGYGTTKFGASLSGVGASGSDESFNFGVGGQYHFDGLNGARLDYTYQDFDGGGHANVWSVSYSRRF